MAISILSKAIAAIRGLKSKPVAVIDYIEPYVEPALIPSLSLQDPWLGFMIFGCKPQGDGLIDILGFDRINFDTHHDFIQWLFPNRAESTVNKIAPCLIGLHVDAYRRLPELREAVGLAVAKFYAFMGIRENKEGFERCADYDKGAQYWLCRMDHNHRRISRLLTFFCEIGARPKAVSLLKFLESELAGAGLTEIEALRYWKAIVQKP